MPIKSEKSFKYFVNDVQDLGTNIFAVNLCPLGRGMAHKPGHLCKVQGRDGKGRFYSIVNQPDQKKMLSIHVRITEGKSSAVKDLLKINYQFELDGPYGNMHKVLLTDKTRILFAEGLGLSAFHSLLQNVRTSYQETHLIWVREKDDNAYCTSLIKKWQNSITFLKTHIIDKDDSSLPLCIDYCQEVLKNNDQVILAFAGSLNTSNYIRDEILSNHCEQNLEYISDV